MTRKFRLLAASAAIAVGAAILAAPAVFASASAAQGQTASDSIVLDVKFRPFAQNYVDIGVSGPTVGDQSVFQDVLLNTRGQRVGFEAGSCTFTALQAAHVQTECLGTVSLPGGQISFQGTATEAPVKRLAVVGGTGRYRDATGLLTLTELGHDNAGRLVISLSRTVRQS